MKITKNNPLSTRDKIIKKAENLFSKYNYNSVSLNDIAKEMKITKAALYYHFENKEKLFLEILRKAHQAISEKIEKITATDIVAEEKFRKIIMTTLDTKISQKYLTNLTVQKLSKNDKNISKFVCEFKDESLRIIEPLIKEIIRVCNYPKNTDPKIIAFFVMSALKGHSIQKMCDGCDKWTDEQFTNQIINIIFRK